MASSNGYICSRCFRALSRASKSPSSSGLFKCHISSRPPFAFPSRLASLHHKASSASPRNPSPPQLRWQSTTTTKTTIKPISSPPPSLQHSQASSQPRTTAILNPRPDPESPTGALMTISITPRAAARLSQIMAKDANPSLCLRVSVESGGCHGFQYLMSLTDAADVSAAEDTVFAVLEKGEGGAEGVAGALTTDWREAAKGRPKVVMDEPSLELLKGSKVDYTMELIGSQFKIADNPRATSSCGCGTSFDVKDIV